MKHQFAFYAPVIDQAHAGATLRIDDAALVHRITHVIRAVPGVQLQLFGDYVQGNVTIVAIEKRAIVVHLQERTPHKLLQPAITFMLPLLKSDALAEVVYSLTMIGVNTIQLISTHKSLAKLHNGQLQRLRQITIAAAEQSKQFVLPVVQAPQRFEELTIEQAHATKLLFDLQGESLRSCIARIGEQHNNSFILTIGPEGDFTDAEKAALLQQGFMSCRLTPTILRSRDAALLAGAFIRSWY